MILWKTRSAEQPTRLNWTAKSTLTLTQRKRAYLIQHHLLSFDGLYSLAISSMSDAVRLLNQSNLLKDDMHTSYSLSVRPLKRRKITIKEHGEGRIDKEEVLFLFPLLTYIHDAHTRRLYHTLDFLSLFLTSISWDMRRQTSAKSSPSLEPHVAISFASAEVSLSIVLSVESMFFISASHLLMCL